MPHTFLIAAIGNSWFSYAMDIKDIISSCLVVKGPGDFVCFARSSIPGIISTFPIFTSKGNPIIRIIADQNLLDMEIGSGSN